MGAKCRSLRPLGSGLGKWGYPPEKQSAGLTPNYSLTNTPDGTSRGPHCPIILHSMFLHATGEGQKEAEMNDLPRLPAKPTQAGSQRKLVCHMAGGL